MNIILGGAQFGSRYGISNQTFVGDEQVSDILSRAHSLNIRTIDTAPDYGPSEQLIGKFAAQRFEVGTKISKYAGDEWTDASARAVMKRLRESLEVLGVRKLTYVLFHRPDDLTKPGILKVMDGLQSLKDEGLLSRIGVSINCPEDLQLPPYVLQRLDLVQAPLNPFDQRIIQPQYLPLLKDHSISLHSRSIFLQGLLLMPEHEATAALPVAREPLHSWHEYLRQTSMTATDVCLHFARSMKEHAEAIVLGANSASEIDAWSAFWKEDTNLAPNDLVHLACFNPQIVEPRKWNVP